MDSRLRTNLLLAAVLAAAVGVIVFGPESGRKSPGVPLFDSAEDIARVAVFDNGKLRFALRREESSWRLLAPVDLPADSFQVDALLAQLREPASRRYPVNETDPAALGLDSPRWRIKAGERELLLGGSTALGGQRYVQMGDHVYLVDDLLVYRIQRDPFDYASKDVLPGDREVRAITLPSGQRVERKGSGWTVIPETGALSADALQHVVSAWRNARALRVMPADSVPRDGEVQVEFESGEALRFGIELREDELRLSRADPAVTYVLPLSEADDLLQVTTGGNAIGTAPQ